MTLLSFARAFYAAVTIALLLPVGIGIAKLFGGKKSGWLFILAPALIAAAGFASIHWFKIHNCNGQAVAELPPDENLVGFFGKGVQALAVPERLCGAGCQKTLSKVKPIFIVMLTGSTRRARMFEPMTASCVTPLDFDGKQVCASEIDFSQPNDALENPTIATGELGDIDFYWLDPKRTLEVRPGLNLNVWILQGFEPTGWRRIMLGYRDAVALVLGKPTLLTCH